MTAGRQMAAQGRERLLFDDAPVLEGDRGGMSFTINGLTFDPKRIDTRAALQDISSIH